MKHDIRIEETKAKYWFRMLMIVVGVMVFLLVATSCATCDEEMELRDRYADIADIKELTKRVNGGYNGLDGRIVITNSAVIALA